MTATVAAIQTYYNRLYDVDILSDKMRIAIRVAYDEGGREFSGEELSLALSMPLDSARWYKRVGAKRLTAFFLCNHSPAITDEYILQNAWAFKDFVWVKNWWKVHHKFKTQIGSKAATVDYGYQCKNCHLEFKSRTKPLDATCYSCGSIHIERVGTSYIDRRNNV